MSDHPIGPREIDRQGRALRRHSSRRIPERTQTPVQEVSARLLEPPVGGFLVGRATRMAGQPSQRPMTYSSIANANPYVDESVPLPLVAASGFGILNTSPSRQNPPPPLQLTVTSENGIAGPARMPHFSATNAAEDMRLIREVIAPDHTDKLGQIAASEDGFWMFHVPALIRTYKSGHWVKTDLRVHPQMDPRLLCPSIHEEFLKVCNEGFHEDELLQSYFNLLVSGMDEGRRHLGHLEITGVGGYDKRGKRDTRAHGNESASKDRGRSYQRSQGPHCILRSPERVRERAARTDSQGSSTTRGVTFNLYSTNATAQDGAPSEVILEPAGRVYDAETALLKFGPASTHKTAGKHTHLSKPVTYDQRREFTYHDMGPYEISFSQYVVGDSPFLMMMPDGRPVPKSNAPPPFWPRFERDLPAQSAAQEQADRSPRMTTPIDFSDPAIVAQLEQPWTTPQIRLRIDPELDSRSVLNTSDLHQAIDNAHGPPAAPEILLCSAIDNTTRVRQLLAPGLNLEFPLTPPLSRFAADSPLSGSIDSNPFLTSSEMSYNERTPSNQSETYKPLNQFSAANERTPSEHSETDELFARFPGRLGEDDKDRLRGRNPENESYNAPRTTFFGTRPQQSYDNTSNVAHVSATKTPMSKLVGLASRLKVKVSKGNGKENMAESASTLARPGLFMRKVSEKFTRRNSATPMPTQPRSRSVSVASRTVEHQDTEQEDESEDDNQPKISMAPGDQMWHIGRVEFILNQVANQFLMTQKRDGRMDVASVARINKQWLKQNRPQVVEFMFDLKSQLELTRANLDNFMFYGERGQNHMAKQSLISSWRSVARELTRRTFCLPDHALKKLMVDSFRVLEMLGGDNDAFCEFRDIQGYISQAAERSARDKGKAVARDAYHAAGIPKKIESPLLVSDRGIVDDDEQYYNDGIYKG